MPDLRFDNHGSLWLLSRLTEAGRAWTEEFVSYEQLWGDAIVVEPRYVAAIAEGAQSDGLTVEVH